MSDSEGGATPPPGFAGGPPVAPPGPPPIPSPPRRGSDLYATPVAPVLDGPRPEVPQEPGGGDKPRTVPLSMVLLGAAAVVLVLVGAALMYARTREDPLTKAGTPGGAVDTYAEAVLDGNSSQACQQLSNRLRAKLEKEIGSCWQALNGVVLFAKMAGGKKIGITDVAIEGDRATISQENGETVAVIREDGRWVVDDDRVVTLSPDD